MNIVQMIFVSFSIHILVKKNQEYKSASTADHYHSNSTQIDSSVLLIFAQLILVLLRRFRFLFNADCKNFYSFAMNFDHSSKKKKEK